MILLQGKQSFSLRPLSGFPFILLLIINSAICFSQPPAIDWQRGYKAFHQWNGAETFIKTSDGGFAIAGFANVVQNWGSDMWVAKLDEFGTVLWEKAFGGSNVDVAKSILQTTDGGFIVLAETQSIDGAISGNHGNTDIWILKLDPNGNLIWKKCFGGSGEEHPGGIVDNNDGTFTIAGTTYSNDGDLSGVTLPATNILNWPFSYNGWLFKINNQGDILWQKCYGGSKDEYLKDIKLMPDGGYIVIGSSSSNDGDVNGNHGIGTQDMWIFRTNSGGNILWQNCIGGSQFDRGESIIETPDNGFAAVGETLSSDGDATGNHGIGTSDVFLVKLYNNGSLQWKHCLGGSSTDKGMNVVNYDGNLILSSVTSSNDGDVTNRVGGSTDWWLNSFDLSGNLLWQKCYGGQNRDGEVSSNLNFFTMGTIIADDEGLAFAAESTSGNLPEVTDGNWSAYVIKFNPKICDTINVSKDTFICRNVVWPLNINVPTQRHAYLWNTGDTTASLSILDTGIYWCVSGKNCQKIIDTIRVYYKPELALLSFKDSMAFCNNTTFKIGFDIEGATYLWNNGETRCCIIPMQTGNYMVSITDGCSTQQDSTFVKIEHCDNCLFIPNSFSPNGDGLNDLFGPIAFCQITDFKLDIYSRWGELVYSTTYIDSKWDGSYKNRSMPLGSYFYTLKYQSQAGHFYQTKGDITLIR